MASTNEEANKSKAVVHCFSLSLMFVWYYEHRK